MEISHNSATVAHGLVGDSHKDIHVPHENRRHRKAGLSRSIQNYPCGDQRSYPPLART